MRDITDEGLREILGGCRTVAVVGLSARHERPSYGVARFLKERGFNIAPVNPKYESISGERSWPNLTAIPFAVDIVDVFRRPGEAMAIAEEAVEIGAKVLWFQPGAGGGDVAERYGGRIRVITERCIMAELRRLFG